MISVRSFEARDAVALAQLMREMTEFYGAPISPELDVASDLEARSNSIDIIIACNDLDPVGFATFGTLFPVAGLISFIYIQQIYVSHDARRMGVARRLIAQIARIARARGITRIEWSTSAENQAARSLYDALGAVGTEKIQYVLEGEELARLATG